MTQEDEYDVEGYWYLTTHYHCPVCGHVEVERARRYTKKPQDRQNRHVHVQDYCGCENYT